MAFLQDLGIAIFTWQADGDHIILMADMNGDIHKEEISTFGYSLDFRNPSSPLTPPTSHQLPLSKAIGGQITH